MLSVSFLYAFNEASCVPCIEARHVMFDTVGSCMMEVLQMCCWCGQSAVQVSGAFGAFVPANALLSFFRHRMLLCAVGCLGSLLRHCLSMLQVLI